MGKPNTKNDHEQPRRMLAACRMELFQRYLDHEQQSKRYALAMSAIARLTEAREVTAYKLDAFERALDELRAGDYEQAAKIARRAIGS